MEAQLKQVLQFKVGRCCCNGPMACFSCVSSEAWQSSSSSWENGWSWEGHGHGDDSQDNINISWDDAERRLEAEENTYWAAEEQSRLRNAGPTMLEASHLQMEANVPPAYSQEVTKVLKFFGQEAGANAASKRILKYLDDTAPQEKGECFGIRTVGFSICKSRLLASRAGQPDIEGRENVITCRCFAKTYCMGSGCKHRNWKMHNVDTMIGGHTLCSECSVCLRCGKYLGCMQAYTKKHITT